MSNQGIRAYAREVFVNQNELRRRGDAFAGPKGNTEFRKTVMCAIMTQHGVTLASAATHYNDAFKFIKEQNAELVSGLGRPDDKKGGRKPKIIAAPAAEVTRDAVLANMLAAIPATVSDITESTLLAGAVPPAVQAELEEVPQPEAAPTAVPRSTYWQAQMAGAEEAAF